MSEWVGLDVIDGIGPVAVKRRSPRDDDALLDHEAAILAEIDLAGVVRLVERRRDPDPSIITHFVGTHSLATAGATDIDAAIELVASLAATVAELHRLGVRHGAIDPSHVLLGPGGRPVLCGFSGATAPGTPTDQAPTTSDDVAALGRLITHLVAGHDGLEPIPARRPLGRGSWTGYRPRALLTLADHCQADDPDARPSAAVLAATVAELVDPPRRSTGSTAARLRAGVGSTITRLRGLAATRLRPLPGSRGGRRIAVVGLALLGLTAGGLAWRSMGSSVVAAPEQVAPVGDAASSEPAERPLAVPSTAPPATGPPASPVPACPGSPPTGADTDGDGCADGTPIVDGHTVTVGDVSFTLGRPGDRVLVGDWDCDGLATAVMVRADSSSLWHFSEWTGPDQTITADLIRTDVAPSTVRARAAAGGCDDLIADVDGTGDAIPVVIPS
jgi:hypothetical protein